ncbi:hypothetical protein DKAM_1279 [Desulfurococcus amylolyticus 1221n]|uniref:Uncharacterized protein n=1 Tax=Desulfurococcus amylolyticus (strain DSM 18924 / JCM 16383 / VKM B-2413 / 1221n) TaxID=490899 RepID=B8D674_DESA1|nr:hypothetical protein DKAM_1279 [Desulfurococcus amylolyticus 1221n]
MGAPCSLGEAREPRPGANPANKTSAGKRLLMSRIREYLVVWKL